ncbi:VanZ family protein [Spirosoma soli]|uniref:VanZ family protein n=1 Tax=Spirosoma soli TaxID=1770529 RepID=A0ABW5M5P7_9BACT
MNYSTLRYGAAITWTIIMLIGCTIPGPDVPPVMTLNDKFMHIGIFVPFAALWIIAGRRPMWVIIAGLLYGILIEVIQGVLPIHRSADVKDAIADFIGTLLGVGVGLGLGKVFKI